MSVDKMRILLVDDDAALAETLQRSFNSMGCETLVASNGLEALEVLRTEKVAMIVSDIRMPRMNGLALLKAVQEQGLNIPMVIMTGYSDYTTEDIDQNNGAVLLRKPFSRAQLQEIVEICALSLPSVN